MKHIFLLLVLPILISGCDVVQYHKFRSYITTYYDNQEFVLNVTDNGNIHIEGIGGGWLCGWESEGREKVIYDSLCVLHNDMSYNKKRDYIVSTNWGYSFKGDIASIDVVSNADFDEQHPANASLNDVMRMLSVSLYPYILSGYKNTFNWEHDLPESFRCEKYLSEHVPYMGDAECYHPIDKRLTELTKSDLILVDFYTFLVFEKQPDMMKEHKLTITIRLSDGRVFSPTVTKIFE